MNPARAPHANARAIFAHGCETRPSFSLDDDAVSFDGCISPRRVPSAVTRWIPHLRHI